MGETIHLSSAPDEENLELFTSTITRSILKEITNRSSAAHEQSEENVGLTPDNIGTKWYHIDLYMLPAKFAYFFQLCKEAYRPFLVSFLVGTGLSVSEASFIVGARVIGMIFGSPFWGYLSDKYSKHGIIMVCLCLSSILLMCSQPFLAFQFGEKEINRCPIMKDKEVSHGSPYNNKLFFIMLLINIVTFFVDGSTMGLTDAGVVHRIKMSPKKKDFGWNRIFGSFGFTFGTFVSGLIVQNFPQLPVNCYAGIFISYFVCTIGLLVNSWFLYSKESMEYSDKNRVSGDLLLKTLKRFDVILFFSTTLMYGIQQGLFINFTTVTLKEMEATSVVQGLSISIAALSCVFTIALSTKLISFFRGTWNTIIICGLSYFIRFILFAYISNPVLAIPIGLFQAFGFGLFIAASVHHVGMTSPNGLKTTLFGLMNAIHFGAGYIIASIAGGQIMERYGSKVLFSSAGVLILIWCLLLVIYNIRRRKVDG